MLDFFREISQTLSHNKVRTALTGIAVTWGIFMLIELLSMARGVTNSFNENMVSRNNARLMVWSGSTSLPYHGNREGRRIRMKDGDLTSIPGKTPGYVEDVTSRISGGEKLSSTKAQISQSYTGVYPSEFTSSGNMGEMIKGRFISDKDMNSKAKVMVIPQSYATQLFPPDGKNALGSRINCNGLSFLVIGIYESRWNRDVYIPFTTTRMMASDKEDLRTLSINLKNVHTEQDGNEAESAVRNTLASNHDFDPKDENAVYISNYFTNSLQSKKALGILDTCVWILGILTLLTGIVGISNIMFVTVRERTHEIGIRRAIGARPRQILNQVIVESVSITVLFGYIGIVLGTIVTQIIAKVVGDDGPLLNPTVSLSIALEVTLVLVIAGALAGLFPALKALKVKPVEALRDE